MQRRVRVTAPHALNKGADNIIMLVALLIIALHSATNDASQHLGCKYTLTLALCRQHELCLLQNV